ncbi:MAG: type IIA DNA topoisomerase subunit B [Prevotellaceae bacterium]|jgi:topoisomerase-4 subunit B|nr:type IIA DNA topoisomerase subunit B [Prevotellaceae bacterium]
MDATKATYLDDNVITLDWNEHIRRRPGMYIGKLGDGSSPDDGIYILLKEVLDNSVDEYAMGFGKQIAITIDETRVTVRDYGRGIPLTKVVAVSSIMNTGAKYDNKAFKKSVGLNGVGIKAVNALSSSFEIVSFREGKSSEAAFTQGNLLKEQQGGSQEKNGTLVTFIADEDVFGKYTFNMEFVEQMVRHYTYLNAGLQIVLNGETYVSKNGLLDLLNEDMGEEPLYPPIHLQGADIEIVITHGREYGESIASFVNGQNTTQGGTHLSAFREAVSKTIKEFYKKDFDPADVRHSIVSAVSIKVEEPVFESQTKTKLGSKDMGPGGPSVRNFIGDFLKEKLDNYLHRHPETADILLKKILESEKERKAISGIQKLARERAKKSNLHNKKLRDCRIHYNDKDEAAEASTLFITEGDSASGSITKSRDVNTQAVFSLKGKPLNTFGMTKKVVYENEEFNLLQAALNIEDDIENLRYNRVVIATDADVDGMHIRLLLITFFLQFFPDIIRQGHLYILQTPLFRVRNKKETFYCYTPEEREKAIRKVGKHPEITRFKGLGEISPAEFAEFIGETMRLDRVRLSKDDNIHDLLEFYMGKNTPDRQGFIIDHLRIEEALEEVEEEEITK